MLEKPLRMDNAEIQDCLHSEDDEDTQARRIKPLLKQVLDALPEEQTAEEDAMEVDSTSSEFITFLSTIATETLAATNLNSSINILWTLAQVRPAEIDQHIPGIHDLQRATRFTYWRCPVDHGQLIGYTQFLLEKNFIRAPSTDDLAKLRRDIREIACSQCGAPIDLQKDSMCPFCHAPIALIDPEGVASAIRDLRAGKPAGQPAPTTAAPSAAALHDVQLGAILDAQRIRDHVGRHDLLSIGVGAVLGMLTDLL